MAGDESLDPVLQPREAFIIKTCCPLLAFVRQRDAHFKRRRPGAMEITEIVIHDTDSAATRYQDTVNYLAYPKDGRMVSIHYIIGRNHGEILMMVPEEMVANHATTHNGYSIGIELWRNEKQEGYTGWQYEALGQLVYDIMRRRGIPRNRIVGHGSFDRSRYGEPKGFDWAQFDDELDKIDAAVKALGRNFAAPP